MAKKIEDALNAGVYLLFLAVVVFVIGGYVGYSNESGQIIGIVGLLFLGGSIVSLKYPEKYGHIGIFILNQFKGKSDVTSKKPSKEKNVNINITTHGDQSPGIVGRDFEVKTNERPRSKN
jgi:hypothetical protein